MSQLFAILWSIWRWKKQLIVPENDPTADAYIMEATDKDNINATPDDDEYDKVFYFIVGECLSFVNIVISFP